MGTSRNNIISNIFTGVLVLCAVIVTTLVVKQYLATHKDPAAATAHVDDWQGLVKDRRANIGNDSAKVKIVEFSDYQCPYCRALEANLVQLVANSGGKVAVVRYDLPLKEIHPSAYKAAIAAKCAEAQGVYRAFETKLLEVDLATVKWGDLGRQVHVPNEGKFVACVENGETAPLVDADMKTAGALGIDATPTLVINGDVFPGVRDLPALSRLVLDYE